MHNETRGALSPAIRQVLEMHRSKDAPWIDHRTTQGKIQEIIEQYGWIVRRRTPAGVLLDQFGITDLGRSILDGK